MKKLFVSVLAIVSMVACMNDEIVSVQKGNPIAFDSFVENATRVGYNTGNLDGFNVWAFMDSTNGVILEDEEVTGGSGNYTYTNTQYWLPGHTYYFAALAPMNSANVTETLATGDAALKGLGTLDYTNVNGTEDLLYAATSVTASDEQGPVKFQFNHLLSKVKFSFNNGFTSDRYSFEVCDIVMTAPEVGTIDLTADEYAWTNVDGEIDLEYGDTPKATMGNTVSPADERLTIPAGAAQEYIVTFVIKLYVNDITEPAMVYNKKTKISGLALEAGKAYNFAAEINQTTLKLDEIEFDAKVDEWIEENKEPNFEPYTVEVAGTNYDDFAEAVAAAMAEDAPVKFFQHVVIDADTTIVVPAGDTLSLELNGYTLTGVTDQTGSNRNIFDVRGTMNVDGAPLTRAAAKGDGSINIKHTGANMGWGASTNVFNVTAGGVLNLKNVVSKNLGGSDMGFVAHLNNWGEVTLNVDHCTLESNYVAVRVFNSGYDKNNVTIKNSTLKGGSYAFWVHNYTVADFGTEDKANSQKALLKLDIFNGTNEFYGKNDTPIRWGMTNSEYSFADGSLKVAEGVGYNEATETYTVTSAEGLKALSEIVNSDEGIIDADADIVLGGDIDLSTITISSTRANVSNWTPIGTSEKPFTGTFDGNGYTIKNLALVESEAKEGKAYIGFFGYAKDATIKNVTFENVYINIPCLDIDHSQGHIGAVAGSLEGTSTIENVTVKGDITVYATQTANGASRVAVVAGGNAYGDVTMNNVHVIANEGSSLIANNNTGALAGQLQGKMVFVNCSSNIDVTVNKFFAGGLIGIAAGDSYFENCHTTGDVAVVAGREGRHNDEYRVGGIAGGWADGKTKVCTLVGCSYTGNVSGTNADGAVAMPLDYMGYVGRGYTLANCGGSKVIIDGTEFVQVGDAAPYGKYTVNGYTLVSTNDEFNNALVADATVCVSAGDYQMTKCPAGVKIIGVGKNVVIDVKNKKFGVNGDVTIENVKLLFSNANYTGFQHTNVESYKNCTIVGQPFLYGNDVTFEGCTFEQTSANAYNVWTYGAKNVKFVDCVFNCAGKSVLIYTESGDGQNATFKGCTLNASTPVEGKAAIEIDSSLISGQFNVVIENSTANGFANGSVSGNTLWNNKKGTKTTITVDGVTVL